MRVSRELKTMYNTLGEKGVTLSLLSSKGVPPINLHNVNQVTILLWKAAKHEPTRTKTINPHI